MTLPKTTDKPREWWLWLEAGSIKNVGENIPKPNSCKWEPVHVIEYAAFEKLKAELAESEALCETMREMYEYGYESKTMHSAIVENEKLKAENKRLELVSNRLRNSWREDTEELKIECDTLKDQNERLSGIDAQRKRFADKIIDLETERDTLKAKLAEVEAAKHKRETEFMERFSVVANELTRERQAAKVMREALDRAKQFCTWLSRPWYLLTESTDAVDAARFELVSIVDALAKADEIRGGE